MTSNIQSLTQSHKVIRAKKKQKREQVPAVVFDEDARREFLTGFHKRKVAKREESKKRAIEREKQEHLEARREQRRILAEQAAENAARVEEAYGGLAQNTESDDEDWRGIASAPSNDAGLEQEAAYSDEEQLATVTIVEDFDPSTLIHGPASSEPQAESPPSPRRVSQNGRERAKNVEGRKEMSKRKAATTTTKKKVRYETKAARKASQAKQRARRTEKAELAGGKAARKTKAGRKKRR
ncbi:Nucleolar protein 12 (25kDa) domain containing protein [Lactarius tabidus]